MRIATRPGGQQWPGISSWFDRLPSLLPQHEWVEDDGTADLVLAMPGRGIVPDTSAPPALFVVPCLSEYGAWAGISYRRLGFLCLSEFTASRVALHEAAPCMALEWDALVLDESRSGMSINEHRLQLPPAEIFIFLPGSDPKAAQLVARWLESTQLHRRKTIMVIGPLSDDASHALSRIDDEGRIQLCVNLGDADVHRALRPRGAAVFVDLSPSAEISPYLGSCARRQIAVIAVAAGAYAELPDGVLAHRVDPDETEMQVLVSLSNFVDHLDTLGEARAVSEHEAARVLADRIARALDLAIAFRPIEEALHTIADGLAQRALRNADTCDAAGEAFAWLMQQRNANHYTRNL